MALATRPRPMSDERPRRHVSHPILRLDVLGPDGRLASAFRVFCREKQSAVPVGVCCACIHCEGVVDAPSPTVNCLVSEDRAERPSDPLGLSTPVAEVLASQTFVVDAGTTLHHAVARLHAEERHSVAVVDHHRVVIGVLHDRPRKDPEGLLVAQVMSARLALPVTTPVRRALELMAAAHLREVIVVDEDDVPLGTFRDVDGLHWLALARQR